MLVQSWRRIAAILSLPALLIGTAVVGSSLAAPGPGRSSAREITSAREGAREPGEDADESDETLARIEFEMARSLAPGTSVPARAYAAAQRALADMQRTGGSWSEITNLPTQNDHPDYADPVWSNTGAGWFLVSGRVSALVPAGGDIWAGTADGGVWVSSDDGATWTERSEGLPKLSIGSLAVDPGDGSIWAGLGEANTAFENVPANGVYRMESGGTGWSKVGGAELDSNFTYRVYFDDSGTVYAATNAGLYRRSASAPLSSPWQLVLKPDPNPTDSPYRTSHISDVITRAGTDGQVVLAVLGWRGGTLASDVAYNGFYVSTSGGDPGSWQEIVPAGINRQDIGRTTLARATGGTAIYALIESPKRLSSPDPGKGFSNLLGIYVSESGNPAGPWKKIATPQKLGRSGSALTAFGQFPGIQTWYNQVLAVDPSDDSHVYAGLEEVFESTNGGKTWSTIGPYWNFTLPCYESGTCPPTTHPDQHAMTIVDGSFYAGGDGGIWRRSLSDPGPGGWTNTNETLRTLQYYGVGAGDLAGGTAFWGGTQDNGSILKRPGLPTQVIPQGGDGGDVLVDPADAQRAVTEYVFLDMVKTLDGGHSFQEITPYCGAFTYTPSPCDPNPQFIAPFRADVSDASHWVAGGRYVWESTAGWDTECSSTSCDWTIVHDTLHSTTALAADGETMYAGWCGPCNPAAGAPFQSGIDTNYGGAWHTISAPNLPNRYVTELTVDPGDAGHVYAVYGAFSRRWIPGGGTGHVFESTDGGGTWTDITGNLPDFPYEDLFIWGDQLVVGGQLGVFATDPESPGTWTILGTGLPKSAVWDVDRTPTGSLVAATHGRGLWKLPSS